MSDIDEILNVIKFPGGEIDNTVVEAALAGVGVIAAGAIIYKLIVDDKPIMESIMGKENAPSEK
ncbi:hypothetical protein ACWIVU_04280 [Ursidibacter arcticus]